MKLVLWIAIGVLAFLAFQGGNVRRFIGGDTSAAAPASPAPSADKPERSGGGAYAPSPAEDPNLHNSPTRRLGF
jgi:hypothetical protein